MQDSYDFLWAVLHSRLHNVHPFKDRKSAKPQGNEKPLARPVHSESQERWSHTHNSTPVEQGSVASDPIKLNSYT